MGSSMRRGQPQIRLVLITDQWSVNVFFIPEVLLTDDRWVSGTSAVAVSGPHVRQLGVVLLSLRPGPGRQPSEPDVFPC